jgi:GTP-binding protein
MPTMSNADRYRQAVFLLGVHDLEQLPPDTGLEVAFAGRSNSGKSSALNLIAGQRALARISKTPGRTQQINFFDLGIQRFLVDLPGYGYAKVPESVRRHWQRVLQDYLAQRQALTGLILLMDVRRPLTELDLQMLDWCHHRSLPSHILLTKADKLSRGRAGVVLMQTAATLKQDYPGATVQLFSALKGNGVETVRSRMDDWFDWAETESRT